MKRGGRWRRSLPIDKVTEMLSKLLGQIVDNNNIKAALAGVFGPDASGKYVAWVQQLLKSGAVTSALGKIGPVRPPPSAVLSGCAAYALLP